MKNAYYIRTRSLGRGLKFSRNAIFTALSVTTGLTFGLLTYYGLSSNFSGLNYYVLWAATIAAGFLGAWTIDGIYDNAIVLWMDEMYGVTGDSEKSSKERRMFNWLMLAAWIIFGGISGTLTLWSAPDIAAAATPTVDNTAHLEQLQEVNATYATTLSIKREKYNEAERRLAELQSGEDAYILKAIENQKGRKMADLYKSGNSWAAAETKAIRSRASLDYQKKIKAAEKEVSNSYADLNTFIANRDIQGGRTIDNLAATIETRESQNLQTVQRRAGTFWWIDLSLLPLSVLLSLFYAAWKKAAGVVETASQSVHYGLFEIIGLSIGRQVSRLVEWFAKFAGITDSFSSVGRQQTDSSRQQTTPPTDIIPIADSSVMDGLKEEYLFKSVQTLSGRVDNLEEIVATDNRQQFELSADNKTDSGRQLSDNADSFRQQTTDNRQVEVVHDVQDLSKLVDRTKKQYARQFTSETDSARERNKEKAEAGIKQLRELGCVVAFDREDETKLHITTPTVGE